MPDTDKLKVHCRVKGRVQGVGFRYFTSQTAQRLGVTGWVRNRWDGSVEAVAEGTPDQIDKFVSALWKGPGSAFVTEVKTDQEPASEAFDSFEIRRSA